MANEQNLIQNKARTRKELEEITRKAGKQSGKVRKAKKALGERLDVALEVIGKKIANETKDPAIRDLIKKEGYDVYKAIHCLNRGDAKVKEIASILSLVWGYKHGKPIETTRNLNLNADLGNLSDEELDQEIKRTTAKLNEK